ncbi:hypothetical protein A3E39_03995 [Candidatus Uhrbacteria bacterium RIFCSPHIGHO2_12_FULL_60_25]|uniref:DUF5673 domain-containing protein n=1 Tax=Candidatus Uhrbacteria bacterium RIFCSPHIGHO2_12_FULL_60_25 TaxID=1802399 RepID=A0A1F7UMC7_9BACT|nr:MAG: hypothetical protein A3D73_03930 [Candidatus Uhrbacteria bacterium RIFCSPHIGHO2_02_FULL_60_44]OGL79441.1 MAG: hypothetical protein A3E39_03995 [Candidatus Uhrbacteria bacterium RIFCSPHIGHO2_12_FULL_60_25]
MPVIAEVVNPSRPKQKKKADEAACAIQVRAKLVSLNGGVVLGVCIILSSMAVAAYVTNRFASVQNGLIVVLTLAAWVYLLDSVTERLQLVGDAIERSSILGRHMTIKLDDIEALLLIHEGLNQEVGIESLTARYRDGKEERLPLGPCWRRHELEAFLSSVEQAMGKAKLLEEVR